MPDKTPEELQNEYMKRKEAEGRDPGGQLNVQNKSFYVDKKLVENPQFNQSKKSTLYQTNISPGVGKTAEKYTIVRNDQKFWTPLRIGRYYNAIKTSPTQKAPDWIEPKALGAAYKYLENKFGNNWELWNDNGDDDLKSFTDTWSAPPIESIPGWEQKRSEQLTQFQNNTVGLGAVGEWTNYGISKEDWDKLPEVKKLLNRVFRSIGGQAAQQAINLGILGGSLGSIGGPIGTGVGAAIGAGVGAGSALYMQDEAERQAAAEAAGQEYEPSLLAKFFTALNEPFKQAESAVALPLQVFGSLMMPDQFGSVDELLANPKATWEAGRTLYALIPNEIIGSPYATMLANSDYSLEGLVKDGEALDWTSANVVLGLYADILRAYGADKPGAVRPLDISKPEDTTWYTPGGVDPMMYGLVEGRRALANGTLTPDQLEQWAFQNYGFQGETADLIAGYVLDPLDLTGPAINKVVGVIGKNVGDVNLKSAFENNDAVLPALQEYRNKIRQLPETELEQVSKFGKWFAGVSTAEGKAVLNEVQKAPEKQGFLSYITSLTPEAKAAEIERNYIDGMTQLLDLEGNNVDGMYRLVSGMVGKPIDGVNAMLNSKIKVTVGGEVQEVELPRIFQSSEAQFVPMMMADVMPRIDEHYDSWKQSRPYADMMQRFADASGVDVRKMIDDVSSGKTDLDKIKTQIKLLSEQGNEAASSFAKIIAGDFATLTKSDFKKAADLFYGKNATALTPTEWGVKTAYILAESADKWAAKYFNVKPAHALLRMANVVKQVQSLTMLGFNPGYLANNAINNIITMSWDGLFGYQSKTARQNLLKRFGEISFLEKGQGIADAGITEVGASGGYDLGTAVREAGRAKDKIQAASDLLHKTDKVQVMAKLSQTVEQWSSEIAVSKALSEFMNAHWRAGDGFDKMPDGLRASLNGLSPNLAERIESMVASGMNKTEIERNVFDNIDIPSLKSILSKQELALMDSFPGLVQDIDAGIRAAKTPEEQRAVFRNSRKKITENIDAAQRRNMRVNIEKATVKAKSEGLQGVLDMVDALTNDRLEFWTTHLQRMEDVAAEAANLVGLERSNLWRSATDEANRAWNTFENTYGAKWLGVFDALGSDKIPGRMAVIVDNMTNVHDVWNNFFQTRTKLMDEYNDWVNVTNFDGMTKKQKSNLNSTKWAEISERLNTEYTNAVLAEEYYQRQFDTIFAYEYNNQFGNRADAEQWRSSVLNVRRQMAEAQLVWRNGKLPESVVKEWGNLLPDDVMRKIVNLNDGQPIYSMGVGLRDKASKSFYTDVYQPFIRQMLDASNSNAPGRNRSAADINTGAVVAEDNFVNTTHVNDNIFYLVSKYRPDLSGADAEGNFTRSSKLDIIKWLRKYSAKAREENLKRWKDIRPEHIFEAGNAEIEARALGETAPVETITEDIQDFDLTDSTPAEIEDGALSRTMNTANELRSNADNIEANAPAEETNAEIYKGYLYDVFARNYTDNPARGIERADAVFEVIDTISGTFAKENGITKDQFYSNFVLSKEGDVPDQALLRQSERWYYSQLINVIENKMPEKTNAQNIRKIISGAVTSDELKWTGFNDWLDENPKPTKQDVLDFLNENQVAVEEKILDSETKKTLYDKYTTEGNKKSYKELLLYSNKATGFDSQHFDDLGKDLLAHTRFDTRVDADGKRVMFVEEIQSDWHQKGKEKGYLNSLTKESKERIKAIDKEIDDLSKESLSLVGEYETSDPVRYDKLRRNIENLERERSFIINNPGRELTQRQSDILEARYQVSKEIEARPLEAIGMTSTFLDGEQRPYKDWSDEKLKEESIILNRTITREGLTGSESVRPAPFTESWEKLVIKRIIRWAAENGYDRVSWANGKMNADRYNLSNYIDRVDVIPWTGDTGMKLYEVTATDINGRRVVDDDGMSIEKIQDTFGNDFASKLSGLPDNEKKTFSGKDELVVGGEGMRSFYDERIPNIVKKYIKQWGVSLGETSIDVGGGSKEKVMSFDVTPEMKSSVMSGQPLFRDAGKFAGGATYWLDNGKAVIHAFKRADVPDMLHEYIHAITPMLNDADKSTVSNWYNKEYGRKLPDNWNAKDSIDVDAFEKLARAFERYMTEGPANFKGKIAGVLSKIKTWMLDIYKSITHKDININLNKNITDMFDRWLGAEQDVAPIETEPVQMNDNVWNNVKQGQAEVLDRPDVADNTSAVNAPLGTGDELIGAPIDEAKIEGYTKELLPLIDRAERSVLGYEKKNVKLADNIDKDTDKQLRSYLGRTYAQLADTKMGAIRWAETRRNAALLDYTRKTGFDNLFGVGFPYQFWYTRSMMQWGLRAINKPSILSNYYRLMQMGQRDEERDGFPNRLKGKIAIPSPWLPDWMGGNLYIDPLKQVFPFLQMARPFEELADQNNQVARRTEQLLQDMYEAGDITIDQYEEALNTRAGSVYATAQSNAIAESDQEFRNPTDFMFAMVSPSLPISIAYNLMTGRKDYISQLPITRTIQTLTAAAGIGGPRGVNIEAPLRRQLGMPEIDRFEDFRVDRELANMTAEGLIDQDEAIKAMIDRNGDAYVQAQQRVSKEGFVRFSALGLSADLFPEGEQEMRSLKNELSIAYEKKAAGLDSEAVANFYDEHPEYAARSAWLKEPEDRLRTYLQSIIWENYSNLDKAQKDAFREAAGDAFQNYFIDKKTRNYDAINTDTLTQWANALNEDQVPDTQSDKATNVNWVSDDISNEVQQYYDQRDQLFPQSDVYIPEPFSQYAEQDPEFSKWQNEYLASHPDVIQYVIGENNKLYGLPQDIQQSVYQYRATRDALYPDIFDTQSTYFDLTKQERKAFLNKHPELREYWTFQRKYAAQNVEAAPYILSEQSLSKSISGEDNPAYLTKDQMAMFSNGTILQIYSSIYRKEEIKSGARAEINAIWKQLGQPYGNVNDWIEEVVKPSFGD